MAAGFFNIAPIRTGRDLAQAARLFADYAASLGVDLAYQDFAGELAGLPGVYAPPHGALFLARDPGGEPVGCVALRAMAEPGCAEMKRLYVAPAGRGAGLGTALVRVVLEAARDAGHHEVRLDTLPEMTEALALYRRAGFEEIAAYYDTPVAGTRFLARRL